MPITQDFASLRDAVQSWCARSDTKFRAQIPVFVAACEDRIYNGAGSRGDTTYSPPLRSKLLTGRTSITMTAGEAVIPDDVWEIRTIRRPSDGATLEFLTEERLSVDLSGDDGDPIYYSIAGSATTAAPTWTGELDITYWRRFPPLSEDAATNTNLLLQTHPLLYLEGTLYEAFTFIRDAELAVGHLAKFRSLIEGINRTSLGFSRPGPLRIMPRVAFG